MNLLVVKFSTFSKWANLLAYYCNIWECLFQEVGKLELVLPTTRSYSYGQELVSCGHSSYHNCMNSWLGKPSSSFPTSWKRYSLVVSVSYVTVQNSHFLLNKNSWKCNWVQCHWALHLSRLVCFLRATRPRVCINLSTYTIHTSEVELGRSYDIYFARNKTK